VNKTIILAFIIIFIIVIIQECNGNNKVSKLCAIGPYWKSGSLRVGRKTSVQLNLSIVAALNCLYAHNSKKTIFLRHYFLIATWIGLKFFRHQASIEACL